MKQLTFSAMAAARLRANKRQYLSLVLGIFLSVFLVSSLVLGMYGVYLSFQQKRYDQVGFVDMVVLDDLSTDEELKNTGYFETIGHAYVSGVVTERNIYLGYYDAQGQNLMNLAAIEGRLPEAPGEIAVETSALDVLDVDWAIGDTVELDITPIDGNREVRQFTVVGYLPERSVNFTLVDGGCFADFPAIVTCPQETFSVGRVATHFLLGLENKFQLHGALQTLWDRNQGPFFYGLDASGRRIHLGGYFPLLTYLGSDLCMLAGVACILTFALLLSCGVGISGAMEGMLSKRRKEIGVLRAVGATRRQIRRMFGRENWILALLIAPAAIGLSCVAIWVLSIFLPTSICFGFRLWLLVPIATFSMAVILLSGYLPLVRASKLMPMSVIRDTGMLRRSKGVKGKKEFSPTKLIAARQIRFNPTRQIGSALLVALMLLCTGLFVGLLVNIQQMDSEDYPAFELGGGGRSYSNNYSSSYDSPSLSQQSIRQIRSLDHVQSLTLLRSMRLTMVLDEMPRHAILDGQMNFDFGMLDDEMFQEALAFMGTQTALFHEEIRESSRQEYLDFLEAYEIDGEAYVSSLVTMDLTPENLDMLNAGLESGKIDVDAINAGREVIIVAPEIWWKSRGETGYSLYYSQEEVEANPRAEGAERMAWNNAITAGQQIPLIHIYQKNIGETFYREDATVTVGAVTTYIDEGMHLRGSSLYIITTEQGLANMGFLPEGLYRVQVYVDEDISLEEEAKLEEKLNSIARRTEGYDVSNRMKTLRESARQQQQTNLLLCALITLFFSVSVGMVVSSVTRQINAEGRTIGMLRAVGADERAILGCYSGSMMASIGGGLGIGLTGLGIAGVLYGIQQLRMYGRIFNKDIKMAVLILTAVGILSVLFWFACRFFLRLRIREIVNKSIIDNIREL